MKGDTPVTDPTPATRQEPRTEAGRRVVTFSTVAGVDIRNWRGYPAEVIAIEAAVLEAARERVEGLREKRERLDALYRTYGNDGSRTGSAVAEAALLGIGIYDAVLAALREEGPTPSVEPPHQHGPGCFIQGPP